MCFIYYFFPPLSHLAVAAVGVVTVKLLGFIYCDGVAFTCRRGGGQRAAAPPMFLFVVGGVSACMHLEGPS